jgi:hypothetical protein
MACGCAARTFRMAGSLAVVPLALTGLVCSAAASAVKPQITGLVDMGVQTYYSDNEPFPTVNMAEVAPDAAAFSAIVVNIDWPQ